MLARGAPILVGVTLLAVPGTSSGAPLTALAAHVRAVVQSGEQTNAGAVVAPGEGVAARIAELRRSSGFTWDQVGRLFGVSRRAVHFWASGKPMTAANEERLNRILGTLRVVDRGSALANRTVLLQAQQDGTMPSTCSRRASTTGSLRCLAPARFRAARAPQVLRRARHRASHGPLPSWWARSRTGSIVTRASPARRRA